MDDLIRIGAAAQALGVSADTLRRWERAGRVRFERRGGQRYLHAEALAALLRERATGGERTSARNRFPGVVRSVEVDGVMALVEIEAGPHRVTAAVTRDAVEELGLAPGVPATAAVKATSVMVERG